MWTVLIPVLFADYAADTHFFWRESTSESRMKICLVDIVYWCVLPCVSSYISFFTQNAKWNGMNWRKVYLLLNVRRRIVVIWTDSFENWSCVINLTKKWIVFQEVFLLWKTTFQVPFLKCVCHKLLRVFQLANNEVNVKMEPFDWVLNFLCKSRLFEDNSFDGIWKPV